MSVASKRRLRRIGALAGQKAVAQRKHSAHRLLQRFDIVLSKIEHDKLILDIQEGRAKFLDRQSIRVTRWMVTVNGKEFCAVYDKKQKQISTFLTQEMVAFTVPKP